MLISFAVDCPPGFYEESGQCVLCPLGQYQDQLGSTDCKACPDDLTWDVMGATDITQCLCESCADEERERGTETEGECGEQRERQTHTCTHTYIQLAIFPFGRRGQNGD